MDHQAADPTGIRITYHVHKTPQDPDDEVRVAFNRGVELHRQGDANGARAVYRQVIDSDHPDFASRAAHNLGWLLVDLGDTQGARAAFEKAVELGHPEIAPKAAFKLGQILRDQGDRTGAEAALQIAVGSDEPVIAAAATIELGLVVEELGDRQRAIVLFREAVDCDDPRLATVAAGELGRLVARRRPAEAEPLLRRAVDAGHERAMPHLAALLLRQSRGGERAQAGWIDIDSAIEVSSAEGGLTRVFEAACRQALPSADARLAPPAVLEEAERLYRRAIDAGQKNALNGLGDVLAGRGRLDEAESYYRRAIDAGSAIAWTNLARLLMRRDPAAAHGHGAHAELVRDLLERGLQAGDSDALILCAALAVVEGEVAEAERRLGRAVESGNAAGRFLLLLFLAGRGRLAQTRALVEQIVADDDQFALDALERVTVFADAPQVLAALTGARSTHDPAAWQRFADLFATVQ